MISFQQGAIFHHALTKYVPVLHVCFCVSLCIMCAYVCVLCVYCVCLCVCIVCVSMCVYVCLCVCIMCVLCVYIVCAYVCVCVCAKASYPALYKRATANGCGLTTPLP